MSRQHVWHGKQTQYFYELTPDQILAAFETSTGLRATGRSMILNSMENRVYELEIDGDFTSNVDPARFRIVKFYRPGRWNAEQILEEHAFLADLAADEIPVVAPETLVDGKTLHHDHATGLYYAVFPKMHGRSPQELNEDDLAVIGRLLARLHNAGATCKFAHRLTLAPDTYGRQCLNYLLEHEQLPRDMRDEYRDTVLRLCDHTERWFEAAGCQRLHGDCHLGNLIFGREGFAWVDFDDAVNGPPVQDLWLIVPGRDDEAQMQMRCLLEAYEVMRPFDYQSLRLIEPLRALRFNLFHFWIASRWQDPAFKRAFPHFGSDKYWWQALQDMKEQWQLIGG